MKIMYIITNNEGLILKVSIDKENEEMIEVTDFPDDLLENPNGYIYINNEFINNDIEGE